MSRCGHQDVVFEATTETFGLEINPWFHRDDGAFLEWTFPAVIVHFQSQVVANAVNKSFSITRIFDDAAGRLVDLGERHAWFDHRDRCVQR